MSILRLFLIVLLLAGAGCARAPEPTGVPVVPHEATGTLTLLGDVIVHTPVAAAAFDRRSGDYDFRPMFAPVRERLSAAHLTTAVLETPVSDTGQRVTGFPLFNAPRRIADALQWAGVDLVFTATNHSLDRGEAGIVRTLRYLDELGLPHTGTRLRAPAPPFVILPGGGLQFGFVSYTTATNGLPVPDGKPWLVNLLGETNAAADIAAARAAGADVIVAALHAGWEYQRLPSDVQEAAVQALIDAGADIITGSHVHVVQPWELRVARDPQTGARRTVFVAWSLGNLLSNQYWRYSDYGLAVTLQARKRADGTLHLTVREVVPLWVQRDGGRGYLLRDVGTADAGDTALPAAAQRRMAEIRVEVTGLMRHWETAARLPLHPDTAPPPPLVRTASPPPSLTRSDG